MDELFCRKRLDILSALPAGTNLVLTFAAIKEIAFENPDIIRNNPVFVLHERFGPEGNSYDVNDTNLALFDRPTCGVFQAGTVMSAAIQVAAFLRAPRVRLLGLDIGNADSQPRFYETAANRVRTGLTRDYDTKILPFMQLAAHWYRLNGLEIANCSPVTKLPYSVIPYLDFESL